MAFTDSKIKAVKPAKTRFVKWEDGHTGLGVRVAPSGVKTFVIMYRFDGIARMMTLGKYPNLTLAGARVMAAKARETLSGGTDPGAVHVQKKKADREAESVAELVDLYLEKYAKPRKRSWKEDERILNKDVIPVWGRRKAKSIKRQDVVKLLDKVSDRGAPIQANRTLATVRKMFNFAVSRCVLEFSPCMGVSAPSGENRRDRVLSEPEIKKFWFGLDNAAMSPLTRLALKFQLITAQRKGEVVGAEWSEFDLKSKWWTIPAEKAKNKTPHRVPLSPLALDVLKEIKSLSGESNWLFPSPHGDKPITGPAIDHAVRNNYSAFEIDPFTPHDLRRTAATHITSSETSRILLKQILNHKDQDVTGVYDRYQYAKEKQASLDTWSRKLEAILTGKKGKVIPMRK